ncbi:sugar phosphate isomerase/epimerase family protein [Pedobacter rhizosphaerae]|uniref:Sugar phosphate isomerase/epimerase n=1 Tax=Pedobacter rhizosphaerae TaxID=390241 RepID=A0A1H9VVJ4_9SPHI|nr:sugar phosphate isomerase/epimerase family protein [Pedobacter rhizosphaerae]SES25541.1 Sugar phosphate isomerase/epimerase [Pedobacter rhizosphaerae]
MKTKYLFVLLSASLLFASSFIVDRKNHPQLGIVAGLAQDELIYAAGFRANGESVKRVLSPSLSDQEFLAKLKEIKAAKCKLVSCNLFFPGTLKIAGPEVVENRVLTYADSVLSRAGQAGVKYIVLGSGGARNIPAGYDIEKAKTDFVSMGKKLGEIAKKYQVTIVLENLETTETTFITSLKAAAEIVRKVDHPNFRLNADIFHMMREGESPEEIVAAGNLVGFCEIAEKEKRSLPGVMGDDFKPYLRALKKIGYRGFIFMEGSVKNPEVEIPLAFNYLSRQVAEVYGGNE